MKGRGITGLLVRVRDLVILSLDLDAEPCGDVFVFQAAGRELRLCGRALVLSEDVGEFARGLLVLRGVPFYVECVSGSCVAARIARARTSR